MKRKFFKKNKYQNPFLPKKHNLDNKKNKRKKYIFLMVLVSVGLISLGYFVVYSNLWKIKKVSINGTVKAEIITEIQIIVQKNKKGFYSGVIPKNNILFFDLNILENNINDNIVLDKLEIRKKMFDTLEINIKEKMPVLIWNEGADYYYIDKSGMVMGARQFEQLEYDLPFINHGTTTQLTVGKKILNEKKISFVKRVLVEAKKILENVQIVQIIIPEMNKDDLYFYTKQGWYFILSEKGEITTSLVNLKRLLAQKIKNTNNLEYIDLRIKDKLFYKIR